ncbi:hypothetical protein [Clavibacter michiganensis]|uniref:hypothetical protein n=1 Tax=Clavibacter michiganensis TaxID=28447 RepID=UPI0026DC055D|nr:hypothetical protein [Clavibacter michiganensis]MDO4039323.1 hypothetical protein [Clavibacter michiganensis]MDO4063960.1 hypothetical protein [Clavibacter michiganensis]MDO4110181.1 hypothetical protein [Clavibacter michiganensis]MDO4113359.1 hypothetical protein [Clavibacter michiganensis]MDO4116695.1 hypothetical protein [Clavibacter michiganensis]
MTDQGDGVDEELSSAARVAITVATQMADRLARAREEAARTAQSRSEQEARQLQARFIAERDAAAARLAVVERPEFWDRTTPTQQADMHEVAQQWKDYDPRAQAASETIGREFQERYNINVNDPQANPDAVREVLVLREQRDAEAAAAAASAEKSGRSEAAVEVALAGAALDEAARLDARAAEERVDASGGTTENTDTTDRSGDQSRADQAAALELQAREYDQQADAGGTPTQNADELRELASDARAQAQLYCTDAPEATPQTGAPQRAVQAGAEVNAVSDQGHANAERSAGEVKFDSAERRQGMAARMQEQGIPQEAINIRMRAEVAQGRPAAEAVQNANHVNVPTTKRGRGADRSAGRSEQAR